MKIRFNNPQGFLYSPMGCYHLWHKISFRIRHRLLPYVGRHRREVGKRKWCGKTKSNTESQIGEQT